MAFDRSSGDRALDLPALLDAAGAAALVVVEEQFGVDGSRLATITIEGADAASCIFLGRRDGAPLFLLESSSPIETMLDFRAAAAVLEPDDVALLSYAQGMRNWMRRTRFCAQCGAPLEPRQGGHVRACTACGALVFPRTDPAVMMLVTRGERLFLARHHGYSHAWSTLAGFVEPGESLEDAVRRELAEETSMRAASIRYFGSQPWPLPASLMIGFEIETESEDFSIDPVELLEGRWFTRAELEAVTTSSRISLSGQMIGDWKVRV